MKTIIIFTLCLLVCLLGIFNLPLFKIKDISIPQNTLYLKKDEFNSHIAEFKNKNIFKLLLFTNKDTLKTLFPSIKSISFKKKGFNQLIIEINERTAWISCIIDGKSFFIDKEGIILTLNNQLSEIETENVFIVKGLSKDDLENNKIKTRKLNKLISLKRKFDSYLPNQSLLIEKSKINTWNLIIDDNITILFGELNDFDMKFSKIFHFLNKEKIKTNKKIDYIDCRINNKLLVSYAK